MAHDRYGAILCDGDESQRVVERAAFHHLCPVFLFLLTGKCDSGVADGEHQAPDRTSPLETIPPANSGQTRAVTAQPSGVGIHFPVPSAARLMAARIRVYVPHRQRFPLIPASM